MDPQKEISIRTLFGKYILRIVTAYLFWAILYAADGYFDGVHGLKGTILAVIRGHYHLWYLQMIVLLYALVPLVRKITASRRATEYFLILSLLIGFLIPRAFHLLECLQLPHTTDLLATVKGAFSTFQFQLGFGYLPYFVLGHYLATYEIQKKWRGVCYLLGGTALGATVLLTDWYSRVQGSAYGKFYSNFSVVVLLSASAIFLFARTLFEKHPVKERGQKIMAKLSGYSFGVFLIHALVLKYFCRITGIDALTGNPLLSLWLIIGSVAVISLFISVLLHCIPKIKKYIL